MFSIFFFFSFLVCEYIVAILISIECNLPVLVFEVISVLALSLRGDVENSCPFSSRTPSFVSILPREDLFVEFHLVSLTYMDSGMKSFCQGL